jgi:hypothetical protein
VCRIDKFYFIAIDKASLDIGIYGISPEFVEEGERKTMEAIELYKQFFILGEDLDSYTIVGNPLTPKRNERAIYEDCNGTPTQELPLQTPTQGSCCEDVDRSI